MLTDNEIHNTAEIKDKLINTFQEPDCYLAEQTKKYYPYDFWWYNYVRVTDTMHNVLYKLKKEGIIINVGFGEYKLNND